MLEYLRIRNLALIQDMELEFDPGLNVLTGESGAGKSFILRALDFIVGERLSPSLVRPGQERAQVEALFHTGEGEFVLRRELAADTGRSRVFVNDSLSGQERIRAMAPGLLMHTSQHAQQRLLKPSFHVQVVDGFLREQGLLEERDRLLAELKEIHSRMEAIRGRCAELTQKRELLEFQRTEIAKVDPRPGEEEELLRTKEQVRRESLLQDNLRQAMDILHSEDGGLADRLQQLQRLLLPLAEGGETFAAHIRGLEDAREMLRDLQSELRRHPAGGGGKAELESIESRLWELSQLRRRLKRTLEEIVGLRGEIEENLSFLDQAGLDLKRLERMEREALDVLSSTIDGLNRARGSAAGLLKSALEKELHHLGFPTFARVEFELMPVEIALNIVEARPRMLWVPNPGHPPQALDRIASGGELSRFLLALAGLRSREDLPTLLFDEVDAGIGGMILNTVGERIRDLAMRQQVILVTHWPQLARHGQRHFRVTKEVRDAETFTLCERIAGQEVLEELARMSGGDQGLELASRLKAGNSKQEIRNSK
jgi:DNA repair protein RecN (Recombination protein N)